MKKAALLGLIFLCVLGVVFKSSGSMAESKKPVKIFSAMVLSGVVGAVPETGYGLTDAADYINATGGIEGRPFVAIVEDGMYDVPTTIGIFNRYTTTEPKDELLFFAVYNTPGTKALAEKINKEEKIPDLDATMSEEIFNDQVREKYPYLFSTGPSYGDQWGMVLKYIKTVLHKKSTPPRVAFHYYDNSTGRDPMEALEKYAKQFGVEIVMMEPFSPTAQTFAPAFLKMKKEKIEYVLFWNWSYNIMARYFPEAKKYLPDIPILGVHWTATTMGFELCKESFDNHYVITGYPLEYETDNKFVQTILKVVDEKKRNIKAWPHYMQSWMMGLLAAQSSRQVLKEGKPLTRENARDALENLKNWDMLGMYGGETLDYSMHKFSNARMLRADWKTKKFVAMTPWLKVKDYLK